MSLLTYSDSTPSRHRLRATIRVCYFFSSRHEFLMGYFASEPLSLSPTHFCLHFRYVQQVLIKGKAYEPVSQIHYVG